MNNQSNRHGAKYRAAARNMKRFRKLHGKAFWKFKKWASETKRQWSLAIKYQN